MNFISKFTTSLQNRLILVSFLLLFSVLLSAIVQVDIPTIYATTTDTVDVPISAANIETNDIYSVYMEIYYNPQVAGFIDVSTDSCITEVWGDPYFNVINDSILAISMFGTAPLTEDGDLCTISFDIVTYSDSVSNLTFVNFIFNEGSPVAELSNGEIVVTNRIPYIEQPEDVIVDESELIDFFIFAVDPFGLDLSLNAIDLPENSTFIDDGLGIGHFEWQTNQISAGEYLVGFSATNTEGYSDTVYVNIQVVNVLNVWLPEIDTPIITDITISIFTDELAELEVFSFYTKILYNYEVIVPTNISILGTLCENWGNVSSNMNNPGEIIISAFDTVELTGNENLIDIEFDVIGADGTFSDLDFEFFVYNDGIPQANVIDGAIYFGTPVAEFSADIIEGYSPLEVQFTDLSIAGPNEIVDWDWDFGDGGTSNLQNPAHTFLETGNYTVSLTVTNLESSTNTETKTNFIQVFPIESNFSANPTSGYFPALEVTFADSSLGNITSWSWDFQNNGSYDSFVQNPVYTYTEAGTFSVKLLVSDGTNYATFIRDNLITVTLVPPKPPEDLQIEVLNNNIELTWTEVTMSILNTPINVDYYLIYSANEPNGNFTFAGYTPTASFTHHGVPLFVDEMFYYVKAYFGTRESLENHIENELSESAKF